jgi:hypothetical protein
MLSHKVLLSQHNFAFAAPATFDPSIYSGFSLWLKADAIVGLSNNDPVASWIDSSGTSGSATQATSGMRPLYKTNVLNGKPCVLFDDIDDGLDTPLVLNDNTNFSIFVVYNTLTADNGFRRAVNGSNNFLIGPYQNFHQIYNGGFIQGPGVSSSFVYVTYTNTTSVGAYFRVNGADVSTNANTNGPGTVYLGDGNSAYNDRLNGHIAETLMYTSVLNASAISAVETYLRNKYAL